MYQRFALLLILVLFIFTGCRQSTLNSKPLRANQRQPQGQLLIWYDITGSGEAVGLETLKEYIQLYPQVQIVVEYIPPEQLQQQLITHTKRGLGPDLILTHDGVMLDLIKAGVLRTIKESEIDPSRYLPLALNHVRYQGNLYGIPTALYTSVLCYNKAKVKQAPPKTLEELLQQAKAGYSVGISSSFEDTFWGVQLFGKSVFDSQGRLALEQSGWPKWMNWLKQAQNEPNIVMTDNLSALQQAFNNEKLAYMTCDPISLLDAIQALGKEKLGVAPLPGHAERSASPIMGSRVIVFNRVSSPEQQQLALHVALFLSNTDQVKKHLITLQGAFIPSNKNVELDARLFPIESVLMKQAETGVMISLDQSESAEALFQEGERFYNKVLAGDITPEDAASEVSTVIKQHSTP